ncbi:hypothetical protein FDECE_10117 [Fusarium decemcellulare]|nr:hypothetical protein FDECE_10117 [Fusarium decemcellulare]
MWNCPSTFTFDLLALALLLGIIALITVAQKVLIQIPTEELRKTLIVVGVSISASLATLFVSSRVQHGFLRRLETPLRSLSKDTSLDSDSAFQNQTRSEDMKRLDKEWRAVLRIDSFAEKFTRPNLYYLLIYLCCTLLTPAIVTALTPTLVDHEISYKLTTPDGAIREYVDPGNYPCVGFAPDADEFSIQAHTWRLDNGSLFFGALYDQRCPPRKAKQLWDGINAHDPNDYAYADTGVAVKSSAVGATVQAYKGKALRGLKTQYKLSVTKTIQCVPVMVSNPVQCYPSGNVSIVSESELGLTIEGRDKPIVQSFHRDMSKDSVMIKLLEPVSDGTEESVGVARIAFGTIRGFSIRLAKAMNDPVGIEASKDPEVRYAVTCNVNPRDSFEYREVTLDLKASEDGNSLDFAQYLSGGKPCNPTVKTINNNLFISSTVGVNAIMEEHSASVGYFESMVPKLSEHPAVYAFPNSRNPLEDVLGLGMAHGAATWAMDSEGIVEEPVGESNDSRESYAIVEVTRLGSGKDIALALLAPPVLSFLMLFSLFIMSFQSAWKPGGHSGQHAGESLCELLS